MQRRFGVAHRQMDEHDGEPGPCEYWAYEIDGHPALLVFHFLIPGGPSVVVDSPHPDIDRLIDVLDVRELVTWRIDAAASSNSDLT